MVTKAKSGRGNLLKRGDGTTPTEVFTKVAEITSVGEMGEEVGDIDVTNMDSGSAEEFIAGLVSRGELSFEANFIGDDTEQQGLQTDLRAGTVRNFKLELNGGTTIAFSAIVKKWSVNPGDGKSAQKLSGALKISGEPAWTFPV